MPDINSEGNGLIKEIRPTLKQEQLVQIPDEIFEALYGGAAYGGKKFILTLLPLIRGWYKYEGFRGIIFRRKFTDLEKENIRLSKMYYPKTGAVYNETKHTWFWPQYNSYVDFGHIQHLKDIYNYDSSQYNYAFYDELTHFEQDAYMYIVGSRVRPSTAGCNVAVARSGSNPGGIGQTFVYNRFVRPNENGNVLIKDRLTGLYRIYIRALLQDNPYGLEYDPDYANKLELLPEAEKRAKKYGDWHAFKGSVFTTFRAIKFPGEPDNALHVIKPFDIPEWWPKILSIDWGKRAMCHAMWAAISPDKRVYIYRERYWRGKDLPYWASEIREIHDGFSEEPIYTIICGSAWQDRGVETIADQFQRYSGLVPSSSENTPGSRISGLQLIHDFLRWEKVTTLKSKETFYDIAKANELYRKIGPAAVDKYRKQFYEEPEEENLPRLQIFSSCQVLIDTIPVCVYDDKKTEDIQDFDGDDPIDNLRYLCKGIRKYLDGELDTSMDSIIKRNAIVSEMQKTGDMTSFYRKMEAIDNPSGTMAAMLEQNLPIRRTGLISRRYRRH